MARRSTLRASDADREQIAERLRQATAEGRLLAEELEERLERLFASRTYGELDAIVADLPGRATPQRARPRALARVAAVPAPVLFVVGPIAIMLAVAAVVVFAALFAAWATILTVAWLVFGHGRPSYRPGYRRSMHHAYGRWRA